MVENKLKYGGYGFLEDRRGIFEAKWKDGPLIMGIWDAKNSFVSFRGIDAKLPKSRFQIEFWKDVSILKVNEEGVSVG